MTRNEIWFSLITLTLQHVLHEWTALSKPLQATCYHDPTKREPKQRKSAKWGETVLFCIPETIPIICHCVQSVPFKARAFPTYFPNTTVLSDSVSWLITGPLHYPCCCSDSTSLDCSALRSFLRLQLVQLKVRAIKRGPK